MVPKNDIKGLDINESEENINSKNLEFSFVDLAANRYATIKIEVFDSSGNYKSSFGGYGNSCNRWAYARQFDIYNDKVYIADTYNHRIKVLNLDKPTCTYQVLFVC